MLQTHARYGVLATACIALFISACSSSSSGSSTSSGNCAATSESATFTPSGTQLIMNGTIDCTTPTRLQTALDNNSVSEVVLNNVPGSMDDVANLRAARLLRSRGSINTRVADNGLIASGGVDFFIAGIERTVGNNARVAVHSWQDGNGTQGIDLYNRDPGNSEHQRYIRYYQDMGFTAQNATDFYVYTLRAAPAQGTHCMSAAELRQYQLVTGAQAASSGSLSPRTQDGRDVCTH